MILMGNDREKERKKERKEEEAENTGRRNTNTPEKVSGRA